METNAVSAEGWRFLHRYLPVTGARVSAALRRMREIESQGLSPKVAQGEIRVKLTGNSFGRWVCIVTVDGEDLAEWIIENGLTKADLYEEGG